jgi:kynureninase
MDNNSLSIDLAKQYDDQDRLKSFRNEFVASKTNLIYFDGNSLGRLPIRTKKHLESVINHQWGDRLIRSWNEGWYNLAETVGEKISKIIGAREDEVIIADSTSINLYKLVYAALKLNDKKTKIVTDEFNFPSDHYIIQGILHQFSSEYKIEIVKSNDGITIPAENLESQINNETALVVLSHAAFKSSFLYDLDYITNIAHNKGALILWDLSHSVGVVDIELSKSKVDFAIGCAYKYLNGGPGAPAFLYIRNDLHEKIISPIWGWFGDDDPFQFKLDYKPAKGMQKFLVGTPPILSLSAVDSGLDIILEAGIKNIRDKSIQLSEYLLFLFDKKLKDLDFILGSPNDFSNRGSHISIQHEEAYRICQALMDENNEIVIIPDFRSPNNIRLGLSPLYNSFQEVWNVVDSLVNIVEQKSYLNYNKSISGVT